MIFLGLTKIGGIIAVLSLVLIQNTRKDMHPHWIGLKKRLFVPLLFLGMGLNFAQAQTVVSRLKGADLASAYES